MMPKTIDVMEDEKVTARHEVKIVLQQATRCPPTVLETPLLSPDSKCHASSRR